MKVNDKVVLVTGGGNGLGQQLVLKLLNKGATVAAVDINTEWLNLTKTLAGDFADRLSLHSTDISDRQAVSTLAEAVIEQHGHVDAIINNAGIIHLFEPVTELDFGVIDRIFNVNFHGTLNITKTFLPLLQQRPEAHIVNVSSMGGLFAFPNQTIYGASKAAVKLISEGLHVELAETKIGVTAVFPGAIGTNITFNCGAHNHKLDEINHLPKGTSPATAADKIVRAIEKNQFRLLIGIDAKVLHFFYLLSPTLTIKLLSKTIKWLSSKYLDDQQQNA